MKKILFLLVIAGLLFAGFSQPTAAGDLDPPHEAYTYNGYVGAPDWSPDENFYTRQSWDIVPVPDPEEPGTYKECVTYDNDNPEPFPDPLAPDAATYGGPALHNPYGTPRYYATGTTGDNAWTGSEGYAMGTGPDMYPYHVTTPYGICGGMGGGWAAFEIPNHSAPSLLKQVWVQYIVYLNVNDTPGDDKMITQFASAGDIKYDEIGKGDGFLDENLIGTRVNKQWEQIDGNGYSGRWWRVIEEWIIEEQVATEYFYLETPDDTAPASLIDSVDIVTRLVDPGVIEPPVVVDNLPVPDAGNVKVNTTVSVTFSKSMKTEETENAFSLITGGQTVVGTKIWEDETHTKIIFTPQGYLDCNGTYTVTISTDAQDVTGRNLAEDYIFTFYTEGYTTPVPEFEGIPAPLPEISNTATVTITVGGVGIYRYRYQLDGGQWSGPFAVSDPLVLSGITDGEHTLLIEVEDALMNWSQHGPFTWTAMVPPEVVSTSPGNNQSASIKTAISVVFSEAMNQGSAENAFSIIPDVSGEYTWSGNTMTFTPDNDLTINITYAVTIASTAADLALNQLGSDYTWSFTTANTITCNDIADTYVLFGGMGGGAGKPRKYRMMAAACPIVGARILIKFDISQLEQLDVSQIVKAELCYYMIDYEPDTSMEIEPTAPAGVPMYGFIYPLNTTTYEYPNPEIPHPGGDVFWFEDLSVDSDLTHTWQKTKPGYVTGGPMVFATHTTGSMTPGKIDITEILKGWVRGDYPNNGIELKDHDDRSYTDCTHHEGFPWYLASKEYDGRYGSAPYPPYLSVEIDTDRIWIIDKPIGLPDLSHEQDMTFVAAGGAGSYTWQATGPDGSNVTAQVLSTAGNTTTFTAPGTAGLYNITVTDGATTDSVNIGVSDPASYHPDEELYELSQALFPLFMGADIDLSEQEAIYKICDNTVNDIGTFGTRAMLGKIMVNDTVAGGTAKGHAARTAIAIIDNPHSTNREVTVRDENGITVCKIEITEGDIDPDAGAKIYAVVTDTGISAWGGTSGVYSVTLYNENGDKLDNSFINNIVITMSFNTDIIESDQLRDGTYPIHYTEDTGKFFTAAGVDPKETVPVSDITDVNYDEGWMKFSLDHLTTFGVGYTAISATSPGDSSGDHNLGGGCFVGTSVHGSIFETKAKILRNYRYR